MQGILEKNLERAGTLASFAILLVFWQLCAMRMGAAYLPSPVTVLQKAVIMFRESIGGNSMFAHIGYSLRRVLAAYLLAGVLGIPLGIAMGWNTTVHKIVNPVFELLRPIPPLAWIPLAILWLGIGEGPKIFICFVGAFVVFVLNAYTGMRYTERLLIDAARTFGATRNQQLFNVAIPASLPSVFAGVQNAMSMAWMCVVAAELVGAREGVGFIIIQGGDLGDVPMIIVGMVTIGLIGFFLAVSLRLLERMLCPWRRDLNQ
ncbi:MAG: ABC transporter permease [Deltaproteobacteria bacterium]|jgi:NitT/TauT family transport system permease protein/sulfonate transport system permease protein|nr:ABC transporter permease [Deltaproteobacteria bacterium]